MDDERRRVRPTTVAADAVSRWDEVDADPKERNPEGGRPVYGPPATTRRRPFSPLWLVPRERYSRIAGADHRRHLRRDADVGDSNPSAVIRCHASFNHGGDRHGRSTMSPSKAARDVDAETGLPDAFTWRTREANGSRRFPSARSQEGVDEKVRFERLGSIQSARIAVGARSRCAPFIDALLGRGRREPSEPFASLVRQVNASGKPVLSVDVRAAWDRLMVRRPDGRLHDVKEGMTTDNSDGFESPTSDPVEGDDDDRPANSCCTAPEATSHKAKRASSSSRVVRTPGPALVGFGSLDRIDLVHIATPRRGNRRRAYSPSSSSSSRGHRLLREDLRQIIELTPAWTPSPLDPAGRCRGNARGHPGGRARHPVPMVSMRMRSKRWRGSEVPRRKKAVLTPHSREFQLLSGKSLRTPRGTRGDGPGDGEGAWSHDP